VLSKYKIWNIEVEKQKWHQRCDCQFPSWQFTVLLSIKTWCHSNFLYRCIVLFLFFERNYKTRLFTPSTVQLNSSVKLFLLSTWFSSPSFQISVFYLSAYKLWICIYTFKNPRCSYSGLITVLKYGTGDLYFCSHLLYSPSWMLKVPHTPPNAVLWSEAWVGQLEGRARSSVLGEGKAEWGKLSHLASGPAKASGTLEVFFAGSSCKCQMQSPWYPKILNLSDLKARHNVAVFDYIWLCGQSKNGRLFCLRAAGQCQRCISTVVSY